MSGLASQQVARMVWDEGRVTAEEWLPMDACTHDVREGQDGAIYRVSDEYSD